MIIQLDRARQEHVLECIRLPLGSTAEPNGESVFSWMHGMAVVCSACRKVVGCIGVRSKNTHWLDPQILDASAGWVLERRRSVATAWFCGSRGCSLDPMWDYPMACSDACEMSLLSDERFEPCRPPRGYKRGGPHA